ncbi:hypothetical protein ANN_03320, partial [Periplaneta americana]
MAEAGFPVTVKQLQDSVQRLMTDLKRKNPFVDNRPGRTWIQGFLQRNSNISQRISQNLTVSRASVTQENILGWFAEVEDYLKANNLFQVLTDPSRVFNCDETAFFLNPKGNKVLARKGNKTIYQQVNSDEKECLTVLITGSANGSVVTPLVVYKYERLPPEITLNFPSHWALGKSDSGWMQSELFYEFLANFFHPWLKENNVTLPVILFVDGHVSHLSLHTSQFCDQNGIILVALYPNATHILQPMDVAVFRTLKENWKRQVHEWRINHLDNPILKKKDFAKLLKEVVDKHVTHSVLANGFRKCGLYPWDPTIPRVSGYESCSARQKNDVQNDFHERLKYIKQGFQFLNEGIGKEKLELFERSAHDWEGDPSDRSLFLLWKKTELELKSLSTTSEQTVFNDNTLEEDADTTVSRPINNLQGSVTLEQYTPKVTSIVEGSDDTVITGPMDEEEEDTTTCGPLYVSMTSATSELIASNDSITVPNSTNILTDALKDTSMVEDNEDVAIPGPSNVPSPFKKYMFCPTVDKKKPQKKQPKEKLPAIVSGELGRKYFQNKMNKKNEIERLRKERASERERKKEEKMKENERKAKKKESKPRVKKQKWHEESDSESSISIPDLSDGEGSDWNKVSSDEDDTITLEKNDFVIVEYEGSYFPGKIVEIVADVYEIVTMVKSGLSSYRWPDKEDKLTYTREQIKKKIQCPNLCTRCGSYLIPEMNIYSSFYTPKNSTNESKSIVTETAGIGNETQNSTALKPTDNTNTTNSTETTTESGDEKTTPLTEAPPTTVPTPSDPPGPPPPPSDISIFLVNDLQYDIFPVHEENGKICNVEE